MTTEQKAIVFIDAFLNLDYKHKRAIIDLYDDIAELFSNANLAIDYLTVNCSPSTAKSFESALKNGFIEDVIEKYNNCGVKIITENSSEYPKRLKDLDFRPICLYAKGNIELLNSKKAFSIVGARKTQPLYLKLGEDFSNKLSSAGVTIVTGVAVGGDLSAIKGALDGKNVVCVLASGFNHVKSEYNRDYINKVIEKGLVITEYPIEVIARNYHYPIRNRIIAGLSDGTLIISGTKTSGCRHTANYALDYGKEVFAFPYAPNETSGELCNELLKDGARVVTQIEDITEIMGYRVDETLNLQLLGSEKVVYDLIKNGNNSVDDILSASNLKIYQLIPILTSLEIKGAIIKSDNVKYNVLK